VTKETIKKITSNKELRDIILSGQFDDSIQVKNTEHICKDYTIYDYSEITNLKDLCCRETTLIEFPLIDTSNITDMSGMFKDCTSLITIPLLDTSNVTNITYMFYNCSSLTSIPLLDTSNVTDMSFLFCHDLDLKTIPSLDTSKVVDFSCVFYNSNITDISKFKFIFNNDKVIMKSFELGLLSQEKLKHMVKENEYN
jgi:surface protein